MIDSRPLAYGKIGAVLRRGERQMEESVLVEDSAAEKSAMTIRDEKGLEGTMPLFLKINK